MKKLLLFFICMTMSYGLSAQNSFHSTGKAGAGTNTPITTLEVKLNTNNAGLIGSALNFLGDPLVIRNENTTTGSYAGIGFVGNGNELLGRIGFKRHQFGNGRGEFFVSVSDAGVVKEALTINKNGNVGIGSNEAKSTLEVKLNANNVSQIGSAVDFTGDQLVITNENTTTGAYAGIGFAGTANELLGRLGFKRSQFGNGRGNFFVSVDNGGVVNEAFTIDINGKIGIGTTSPNEQLEVKGNIRVQGVSGQSHSQIQFYRATGDQFMTIGQSDLSVSNSTFDFHHHNGNDFRFLINNTERLRIDNTGNVGIGTHSPLGNLSIKSGTNVDVEFFSEANGSAIQSFNRTSSNYGYIRFITKSGGPSLLIDTQGEVGIGTTSPSEKLEVAGNALVSGEIYTTKIEVSTTPGNWPDYVFEKAYTLPSLNEVEQFINTNKHLPEVPSAKEVEKNGQDLGDIQATLLKKVEELTLYTIAQEKKIETGKASQQLLSDENKRLKTQNQELKNSIAEILKRLEKLETGEK